MQHFVYPACLTPEEQDGGFVVTFPDLPEAITQGDEVSDALRQGADCLEEAIAGRIRRHACLPEASPVESDHYPIPLPAQTAAKAALYLAIRQAGLTQVELAALLHCDEKEVRRLLDPRHASKMARLEAALAALGQQLVVSVQAMGGSPYWSAHDLTNKD
jgi:antitoxin HicB